MPDNPNITALINEMYVRLAGLDRMQRRDRKHFFAMTAMLMRRILVDYARERGRDKRGGGVSVTLRRQRRVDDAQQMADEALAAAAAAGMGDYAAIARATIGCVAWARGDTDAARRECQAALERRHHPAFPFPFEWMARLVLLAVEIDRAPVGALVALAEPMLAQPQMQLPADVERAITEAIAAHDRTAVAHALAASTRRSRQSGLRRSRARTGPFLR